MAAFREQGCYRLITTCNVNDEAEQQFVEELAEKIYSEFAPLCSEPFMLRLGEYEKDKKNWLLELWAINPATKADALDRTEFLFTVSHVQHYSAFNTADPDSSYCGKVVATVTMPAFTDDVTDKICPECSKIPSPRSYPLLHIALGNYYEEISRHYPEWHTSYRDSPTRIITKLGTGKADRLL